MDIIFNCPHCEQEMAVDSSGAGSEIQCPSCGQKITIPAAPPGAPVGPAPAAPPGGAHQPTHTIASSAAAKVEMHLKVPVRDKPGEILVAKPQAQRETVSKTGEKKLRVRTIRHATCIEAGHDKFDERVGEFMNEVGEANIIGIHMFHYTHFDVSIQKILEDYGVLIHYRR